ncbi:MAG: tetratricopeptide repeat protein [Armatimonadetes bacterium]|nr:tetratricopeptide repeat protein [Candidatus Hippobium faecium]
MKSNNMNKLWIPVIICFIICGVFSHFLRPKYVKMGGNSVDLSIRMDIKAAKTEIDTINAKLETIDDATQIKNLTERKTELEVKVRELGEKQTKMNELMIKMPGQFLIATFSGFKDVISGALWVRADEFFHRGDYDNIIPLVRLVTWLDPHNIDIYTTGAWHMDYNFTDEAQRSDKRNIPLSIALLEDGIAKNPDRWDLYFELGWVHYNRKLEDYDNSLKYIKLACEHDGYDSNTGKRIPRPEFVDRMLAHAYEAAGDYDNAIKYWQIAIERSDALVGKKDSANDYSAGGRTSKDTSQKNMAMLMLRKAWRYGDLEAYRKGLDAAAGKYDKWAIDAAEKDYAARKASGKPFGDAMKPVPVNFSVNWKKTAPRKLRIWGTLDLIKASEYKNLASEPFTHAYQECVKNNETYRNGARIWWRISDYDWDPSTINQGTWNLNQNMVLMWDSIYVKDGKFDKEIDFSLKEDIKIYPFKADKYKLTIYYVPQGTGISDFIEDRLGWNGDAISDPNVTKSFISGKNCLVKEYTLDKSDIL